MKKLTPEQKKQVIDVLVNFVTRVGKGGATLIVEVEVFPKVAELLLNIDECQDSSIDKDLWERWLKRYPDLFLDLFK